MTPAVDSLLAQLPEDVRGAVKAMAADMPDSKAVDFIKAGWPVVKLDMADVVARMERAREGITAAKAGARKGLTTQRLNLDPAAATWKPARGKPLNRAVFQPRYGTIPKYILRLMRYMNRADRGTAMAFSGVTDANGEFKAPRKWLARWIAATPRRAGESLDRHRRAGVIAVRHQGGRTVATVWRFVDVDEVDYPRAVAVYRSARRKAGAKAASDLRPAAEGDQALVPPVDA